MKEQQQCKVLPSNGQKHLIPEDAILSRESPSKSSEDMLQQDSEFNNESLHKMDIKKQGADLGFHTSIEDNKLIMNESLHIPGSPGSHAFEDTRSPAVQFDPPLHCSTSMNSVQFGNSTSEASSVHSFVEQCQEPASRIDSVDYMDIDTEAGAEVTKWNEGPLVLDISVGKTDNETLISTFANCKARKPKPLLSPGFLDKETRKRCSFAEQGHIGGNGTGFSQKLNGHCNGHLNSLEQGVLVKSCGDDISAGSVECNRDMVAIPSNGNYYAANGDTQSINGSSHAQNQDLPFVSHGFEPRPYRKPSGSNINCSSTKSLVDDHSKSSLHLPSKDCQGDISFLHRGFLERPCSKGKPVKVGSGLPYSNGTSSFVNDNNRPSKNSSSPSGLSRGFLTRQHKESAVNGTLTSSMNGLETSTDISMEQKSNGAAVVVDRVEERWSSDCTTNRSSFQLRATSNNTASGHLGENGLAILATKNISCGLEIGSNGSPDVNGLGCQMDETPAMLISEKSTESENNALRRRVTSKYFDQNGIDAK
jgi:ubiquitin carboxyl-terminal hydrolase 36/42